MAIDWPIVLDSLYHFSASFPRENINKLQTKPTPNKNGSYGIKRGGVCMPHFWGPYAIFSVEIPRIQRTFTPYGPPLYGTFWGHIFCKYGGWGWSEIFSKHAFLSSVRSVSFARTKFYYEGNSQERNSGEIIRRHRRKTQRNFGEMFCRFFPLISQKKWPQEISRKILHIFHEGRNKILSPRDSGSGGPQILLPVPK